MKHERSSRFRSLSAGVGFGACALSVSLVLLVPRTGVAFDESANLGTMDGTRCDDVVVSTHLERKGAGWVVSIEGENGGDLPQTCTFQTAMERWWTAADVRTPSEVTTLFTRADEISVPPHGKAVVVRDIPGWLSAQLDTADRIGKARQAAETAWEEAIYADRANQYPAVLSAPYPDFRVGIREPHAHIDRVRHAGGMPAGPPPPQPPHVRDRDGTGAQPAPAVMANATP
jgi:hypothetical protein